MYKKGEDKEKAMIFLVLTVILLFIIYFEASEMSLVASDEARLSNLAHSRGGKYRIANEIRKESGIFFSTVLIGINLMTVLFSMILTREIGVTRGLIFSTLIISIVGEILVKSFAIINPEAISAITAPPLFFFYRLFFPLILLVKGAGDGILKIVGIKGESKENITKEEMNIAVAEVKAAGGIDSEQYAAMRSISRLSKTNVRDIMIPRIEVKAINFGDRIDRVIEVCKDPNVAKMPVYKNTIDNIIGILFKEDIIRRKGNWEIKDILRPIKFIHGDRRLEEVLPELLSDKNGCAIVIDEYGGTEGFVSTDDILFNIIGKDLEITEREQGTFIVDGNIRPDTIGILTEEDTLAGYIIRKLQEIPHEGRKLKVDGMEMTILDATERKIKKVLIKRE